MQLDPVTLEILSRKLAAITDEMYFSVQRAARSSYVKEAADFATALLTPNEKTKLRRTKRDLRVRDLQVRDLRPEDLPSKDLRFTACLQNFCRTFAVLEPAYEAGTDVLSDGGKQVVNRS